MKNKFLAFVMVMAMALTMVPGVALAVGHTDCTKGATCTDHEAAVDTTHYDTLEEAIRAANGNGKTVVLLKDVTRASWHQWGTSGDDANYPTLDKITIDGNGKTLTVNGITSNGNGDYLTYGATNTTIKNLTVESPQGFSLGSGSTLDNCTIKNATYGVLPGSNVTITNCEFENCGTAIYTRDPQNGPYTGLKIIKNTFTECGYAVIMRSDDVFEGNTLGEGNNNVNLTSTASSTVTGNTFGESTRLKMYKPNDGVVPTIENNKINGTVALDSAVTSYDLSKNDFSANKTDIPDVVILPEPTTSPKPASTGSGISVTYNGGNSFSTSNPAVPTGVEIDGVAVPFSGTGSNFTVGCVDPNAKWVTVRWNSTTVTTNFTPDGLVECSVSIPKTGDMPIWAAVLALFGF